MTYAYDMTLKKTFFKPVKYSFSLWKKNIFVDLNVQVVKNIDSIFYYQYYDNNIKLKFFLNGNFTLLTTDEYMNI